MNQTVPGEEKVESRIPPEFLHALIYLSRARSFLNTYRVSTEPFARSTMIASAVHSCGSLIEALDRVANPSLELKVPHGGSLDLPFANTIDDLRNRDIHGRPFPIPDKARIIGEMVTHPDGPIKMESSNAVAAFVTMRGVVPKGKISPKRQKDAKVIIPVAVTSIQWIGFDIFAWDRASNTDKRIDEMIEEFLRSAQQKLIAMATSANVKLGIAPFE